MTNFLLPETGTEAMFADLGHFSVRAIQVSYSNKKRSTCEQVSLGTWKATIINP